MRYELYKTDMGKTDLVGSRSFLWEIGHMYRHALQYDFGAEFFIIDTVDGANVTQECR